MSTPDGTPAAPALGQPQQYAQAIAAQQAADEAAAAAVELDETVPGGAYKVGDRWLDANGQEVADPGASDGGAADGDTGARRARKQSG